MRYREILEEGAKAFLPMYQGLPILDQSDITSFIDKIEKKFVRKDRVTWFVRWHRIWYMNHVSAELEARRAREAKEAGQPIPDEPLVSEKVWRRLLSAVSPTITYEQAISEADDTLSSVRDFEHYLQLPVQSIKDIVWDRQSPNELLAQFDEVEQEWQETLKENRAVRIRPDDEKIIDFKNGWAWWNLNRGGCRDEAEAMGHCGNGSGGYGQTILSLRKQLDDVNLSPHLTFILHDGHTLGEMKGRNNDKPVEKYHGMIKALLLSKYVQEIKGGGYLPENNFSLSDLPIEDQKAIKTAKPSLRPAWELWNEFKTNYDKGVKISEQEAAALTAKIEREAERFGGVEDVILHENEMIIDTKPLHNYTSFTNGIVSDLSSLLEGDDLTEMIEKYADNDDDLKDADRIARMVEDRFYIPMVKELLPYDIEYRMYQVSSRLNDKEIVETFIGISDFLHMDDDELEGLNTFDEENDNGGDMDRYDHVDLADPIEHAILDYLAAEEKKSSGWGTQKGPGGDERGLVNTILAAYGSQTKQNGQGGRYYTPTIQDPNQMEFDFDKKE